MQKHGGLNQDPDGGHFAHCRNEAPLRANQKSALNYNFWLLNYSNPAWPQPSYMNQCRRSVNLRL
jgi:hypothetical protein